MAEISSDNKALIIKMSIIGIVAILLILTINIRIYAESKCAFEKGYEQTKIQGVNGLVWTKAK